MIAKNSVFNLLGQVLPMLVGVLTIPYIIKGLGANEYGILSIASMVLGYFSVFDLGLSRATVKFVAEHLSPDKIHKVPELVWTSFSLLLALGLVGAVLIAGFVPLAVTRFFKMPPAFVPEAKMALLILCSALPVLLTNDVLRGVLEAAQRFDLVNYVKVPSSVLFYLVAAFVIPFGVHVSGIVFLLVLIRLASSLAYLFFCFRVFPDLRKHWGFSASAVRSIASFGGWVMLTNIVSPIFGYLERFLIASVLSVGMLTYYSAPYDLVSRVLIFPTSIVPSLFPYFSYQGIRCAAEVSDITSRVVKYLLLVMSPVTAVFVFFARDILQIWLGSQFASQSTVVLKIVAVLFFLNAFALIPFTSVQALGRPDLKAVLDLIVLPVYAIIALLLMKRMGINGAALAKLMITVADCAFLYVFAWKMKAFSLRDCISGPLSRALVASTALVCLICIIASLHAHIFVTLALLTTSVVCYAGLFWVVAVDDEDRVIIKGLSQQAVSLVRRRPAAVAV